MTLVIDTHLVDETLDDNPLLARDAVVEAFTYCYEGRVIAPIKQYLQLPDAHSADRIIAMPVRVVDSPLAGMKWIGSARVNRERGLPRASAVIVLNDPETHIAEAIIAGARISCERTAWAALLASVHAVPDARRIGILGMGRLGETLLRLLSGVFPAVEEVTWFSRLSPKNTEMPYILRAGDTAQSVIRDVDVLFACSAAGSPYITSTDLGQTRCVVSLSLMDFDIDAIIDSSTIVVDNWNACAAAPKIFRDAVRASLVVRDQVTELPTYLRKAIDSTDFASGRTFFNLVGMAIQDIVLASYIARTVDTGRCIEVAL